MCLLEFPLITFISIVVFVIFGSVTDHSTVFRNPQFRLLYRSGLKLYSKSFPVVQQTQSRTITRWRLEYMMSKSGFSSPMAEYDGEFGECNYLLTEYFRMTMYHRHPKLLRAVFIWDTQSHAIKIHGFVTWSYLFFYAIIFIQFGLVFIDGIYNIYCVNLLFGACLLCGYLLWLHQKWHFDSLGKIAANFLSTGEIINE